MDITGFLFQLLRGLATGASLPAPGADSFLAITNIEGLTLPSPSREVQEYKVLDLQATKRLLGTKTYSALTATCTRDFGLAAHDSLEDDANAATAVRRNWRVIAPDSGLQTWDFIGYVSKFEFQEVTNDQRVQFALEITVDGNVAYAR